MAFAISRRVGSAVVRNRLRRQLRAAGNELAANGELSSGWYLVIVSPGATGSTMTTLREDLSRALSQLSSRRAVRS